MNDNRKWHLMNGADVSLGRLSTQAAKYLAGKHKRDWTPHIDDGDYVIVINAKDIKLTGNKEKDKTYYHYSGYPGGISATTAGNLKANRPEELVRRSVLGMLPKNKLRANYIKRLKIYEGAEHPHEAQKVKVENG